MKKKNETMKQVAEDLRKYLYCYDGIIYSLTGKEAVEYKNRFLAAHKREIKSKDAEIDQLKKSVEKWMEYHETAKGERDACLDELKKRDAEIAKLKNYIAKNDINGDTAVACLTEIKTAVEEKMAEIASLRSLVGKLADALLAACDDTCDYCKKHLNISEASASLCFYGGQCDVGKAYGRLVEEAKEAVK